MLLGSNFFSPLKEIETKSNNDYIGSEHKTQWVALIHFAIFFNVHSWRIKPFFTTWRGAGREQKPKHTQSVPLVCHCPGVTQIHTGFVTVPGDETKHNLGRQCLCHNYGAFCIAGLALGFYLPWLGSDGPCVTCRLFSAAGETGPGRYGYSSGGNRAKQSEKTASQAAHLQV